MENARTVYLIRHGIAAEPGPDYPDDSLRPLTVDGRAKVREIARGLVALDVVFDEIMTSPFVRTRQTAEALAAAWPKAPPISPLDDLAVGGQTARVCAVLALRKDAASLALVGHMPSLGLLASELLGTQRALDFKKGSVACLHLDRTPARGAAALAWFATPRMLRLMRRG